MISYLDQPAPGWAPAKTVVPKDPGVPRIESSESFSPSGPRFQNPQLIRNILKAWTSAMKDSEGLLNRLDASAGDGDCGETFASAARAILNDWDHFCWDHPGTLLRQLSRIFEQTVGGTSGALYALMFSAAAASSGFSGDSESQNQNQKIGLKSVLEALERANQAVQKYGGARVGDRTMVDSLDAAVQNLKEGIDKKLDFDEICEATVKVIIDF